MSENKLFVCVVADEGLLRKETTMCNENGIFHAEIRDWTSAGFPTVCGKCGGKIPGFVPGSWWVHTHPDNLEFCPPMAHAFRVAPEGLWEGFGGTKYLCGPFPSEGAARQEAERWNVSHKSVWDEYCARSRRADLERDYPSTVG